MKERPILFKGEMVRAILEGSKTQTRRIIKDQPATEDFPCVDIDPVSGKYKSPYGKHGDRLWVRETWQSAAAMNVCHKADDYYIYRATDPDWEQSKGWKWKHSIFMPKDACRLWLEITDLRVERLQDITEEDAKAEGAMRGIIIDNEMLSEPCCPEDEEQASYREGFAWLWDTINAYPKPVYRLDDEGRKVVDHYVSYPWKNIKEKTTYRGKDWFVTGNPWVWVIQFEQTKQKP